MNVPPLALVVSKPTAEPVLKPDTVVLAPSCVAPKTASRSVELQKPEALSPTPNPSVAPEATLTFAGVQFV